LAIIEWLDENWPDPPLLPSDSIARAQIRAFALAIACDLHPLQNIGVLNRLLAAGLSRQVVKAWAQETCHDGLHASLGLLPKTETTFLFGETITLADILLIPQLANARRFGTDLQGLERLLAVEAACNALPAFIAALPANQPDAE
jgi:maleylpyruvate isomerase